MMFLCELVHEGIIRERFYREGEWPEDVKKDLESFQWPEGEWRVRHANEERWYDDDDY